MKHLVLFLFCCISVLSGFSQSYKMAGNELIFDEVIHFKNGTSELTNEDQKTLIALKDFLTEKKYVSLLRVEGHVGGENSNVQSLSEKRALSVCKWLSTQGVDCKRLIAVGFGNTKPTEANNTSNGAMKNTRIVFVIAALKDKLIGGMPADGGGQTAGDPCKISK